MNSRFVPRSKRTIIATVNTTTEATAQELGAHLVSDKFFRRQAVVEESAPR